MGSIFRIQAIAFLTFGLCIAVNPLFAASLFGQTEDNETTLYTQTATVAQTEVTQLQQLQLLQLVKCLCLKKVRSMALATKTLQRQMYY